MRFSFWPGPAQAFSEVLDLALHAEATGWDGLWYADHFMPDGEDTSGVWNEAWTTLSGLAARVPRIRLGPLVTGNTYRHPAVLAKMAATVDQIAEGRLVLGLGAGWQENEHRAYGIPFYTTRERLARLEEACQVVRSLFDNTRTSFSGRFYQLEDAPLEPKPVQAKLPLLVGGGGEKVTLRIAARYADEWNVWGNVETLRHKMGVLDRHCAEVGRDPKTLSRSAVALLFLSDDEEVLGKLRGAAAKRPMIVGTPAEVRGIVREYRDAGVDELVIPDFNLGDRDAKRSILERFQSEVASEFR